MSSVYVLEPPTKGKVILNTSCGPLDIELWPKETPKACRNFVQLCMEGYYNGTIFHRLIKDFLVQGGDHTGTGHGGESVYGDPFPDEIHTRLKFRHRGFVACASAGQNLNNSQFFITLNRCDWIDGKNTIFGKVTGDTIYNLLKLAESDTDKEDRPLEPPKILSVEVFWNPFDDIVPRNRTKQAVVPAEAQVAKTVKPKKRLNLLSFGEEAQQEEEEISAVKCKIKSSHDVLDDPRLLKSENVPVEDHGQRQKELSAVRQALAGGKITSKQTEESVPSDEEDQSFDVKMRQQLLEKKRRWDDTQGVKERKEKKAKVSKSEEPKKEKEKESEVESEDDDEEEAEVRRNKLVIKKKGIGTEAKAELALKNDTDLQMLTAYEQRRQRLKQNNRNLKDREENTMALLEKFKQKLSAAKMGTKPNPDLAESKSSDISVADPVDVLGWSTHKLKFEQDIKDKMARNDDIDQYEVVDPLLVKGKEQFNKLQAKMKRRNREWAGKSYT